jgi:hypothetical protein
MVYCTGTPVHRYRYLLDGGCVADSEYTAMELAFLKGHLLRGIPNIEAACCAVEHDAQPCQSLFIPEHGELPLVSCWEPDNVIRCLVRSRADITTMGPCG